MPNIITLDNIKKMNLDEIINLYRQGYTLENTDNTYVDSLELPDHTVEQDHITHADIVVILGMSIFSIYTMMQILSSKHG